MSWTRKNRWVLIVLTFIHWNRNKPFTFFLSFHLLYKTLVFLNRDNLVWNRRRTELSSAGCPSADTDVLTDEVEEEEEELISQYFFVWFLFSGKVKCPRLVPVSFLSDFFFFHQLLILTVLRGLPSVCPGPSSLPVAGWCMEKPTWFILFIF